MKYIKKLSSNADSLSTLLAKIKKDDEKIFISILPLENNPTQ